MKKEPILRVFEAVLEKYQPQHKSKASRLLKYAEDLGSWNFQGIVSEVPKSALKQVIDSVQLPWTESEYVWQYENGGYSGDSFAGDTYVPIGRKAYLMFHYQM